MGAAASIEKLYVDAFDWFKKYVDTETYVEDFNSIDKDSDGSISFIELQQWVQAKAKKEPAWQQFAKNPQILKAAHTNAARRSGNRPDRVVDITDFRSLLLHLFATSVLWSHFSNADSWEDGADIGNKQLNFDEFKLACLTLCSTHAGEVLSEEQIHEDFVALDTNNSDSIQFLEVSNYCYKFIEQAIVPTSLMGAELGLLAIVGDLREQPSSLSLEDKHANALGALTTKLAREANAASIITASAKVAASPSSGGAVAISDPIVEETAHVEA